MKRILTGDNTTGRLHLGHYVGSIENRVRLQNDYETFIILADMHALAYPKYAQNPSSVSEHIVDVAIANLACGLDPSKVTFFIESEIPELYALSTLFSMYVSHSRALRNPTIKDEIRDKGMGDNFSVGFINFPILMATDILGVHADLVPVGEDQLPHLELTNEIARRMNSYFEKPYFKEIEGLVGRVARLVGTDGNVKMTKSLDNCIYLNESSESLRERVMSMYTDPARVRATDPGTVEGNPVFIYHDAFNANKEEVEDLKERYTRGSVGDVEVKTKLYEALNTFLEPIREKYAYYESNRSEVIAILDSGSKKVRSIMVDTLSEVRANLGITVLN